MVLVSATNGDDGTHAPHVLAKLTAAHTSRRKEIRGDTKYNNRALDRYLAAPEAGYKLMVVERPAGVKGLVLLPDRWVVERTNAWVGKYRRNSKDCERTTTSAEAMVQTSMLQRLAPRSELTPSQIQLLQKSPSKSHMSFLIKS